MIHIPTIKKLDIQNTINNLQDQILQVLFLSQETNKYLTN